jgi:hypothetical protein
MLFMTNQQNNLLRNFHLTRLVKLHGINESFPRSRLLRAGGLTMQYENGAIRKIESGGKEIIRMVYPAVRDQHWVTVLPAISGERVRKSTSGVSISYDALYKHNDIDFRAAYFIEISDDNHFIFEMQGEALSTFMKNRIGLCILHPIEPCAGKECTITHPDGTQSIQLFPRSVSPHQPFRNIAAMQWMVNEHTDAFLRFTGDVFETEDQRNWTDASFKTYSTPLEIPYPVQIQKGQMLNQKIELDLLGVMPPETHFERKIIFRIAAGNSIPLPSIGTAISSRKQPITGIEAGYLKDTGFNHLRAELHLFSQAFETQFNKAMRESLLLDLPVEFCLIFGKEPEPELQLFLQNYRKYLVKIKSILLLSQHTGVTPRDLLDIVAPLIRKEFPGILLGAGTNCNFAQLNRERPDHEAIDFISFAIHPQEHAGDDKSIFENAAAQKFVVETARQFDFHRPVYISPVTLQRRFNANTSNFEVPVADKAMPTQVDVRQLSLAGAAWTVGSLKYLLESGAESVTFYETVGERGIMMGDYGSQWPGQFQAKKGMFFPVFHVFRMLLRHSDFRITYPESSMPLAVDGFAIVSGEYGLAFLANMSYLVQLVELTGISSCRTLLKMNAHTYNQIIRADSLEIYDDPQPSDTEETTLQMQPYETRIVKILLKRSQAIV